MEKYKRVFVPNPSFRFDPTELNTLAESVVYVSDLPMFDNLIGDENIHRFEHKVAERMEDFDPAADIIAYYGDSMIFAIMVMYLCDNHDGFDVARYSSKLGGYVIRELAYDKFV
jgi:hypothetical protein